MMNVAIDWLNDGRGNLPVDLALFVMIIAAVYTSFRLVWSRLYLPEHGISRTLIIATRRLKLAAYAILLFRYSVALWTAGDIPIPLPSEIAWLLIVACDVMVGMQRLIVKQPGAPIR